MQLPLFPLQDVVLFPNSIIPLHIFEMRYRRMIEDLLEKPEDERFIVVSTMLKAEQTEDEDTSLFYRIATVGKIIHHEYLSDGRSNIIVLGFYSVDAVEIPPDERQTPYRLVQATKRSENWDNVNNFDTRERLLQALRTYAMNHRYKIPDLSNHPMNELLPQLCFGLPLTTQEKLNLLEEFNIPKRIDILLQILQFQPNFINFNPQAEQSWIN